MSRATIRYKDVCFDPGHLDAAPGSLPCGPTTVDCNDPQFAAANPDLCGQNPLSLRLKPASLVTVIGNLTTYTTFVVVNGIEQLVSSGVTYESSNPSIATIDATTGVATAIATGISYITATWHGMTASATLAVVVSCSTAAVSLVIDRSLSSSQAFSGPWQTRLGFAKTAANRFISEFTYSTTSVGVVQFSAASDGSLSPTVSATTLANYVNTVTQSTNFTSLNTGLSAAVSMVEASSAVRKIVILFSDGEQRVPNDPTLNDYLATASAFKGGGGLIICVGLRASGAGYQTLSNLASGGYFVNAVATNAGAVLNTATTFALGIENCANLQAPEVGDPDPQPLSDLESAGDGGGGGGGGGGPFTVTSSYTACCPPSQIGDCVTASGSYTSTISQADAQIHADALARSNAFAGLSCCQNGPIRILDTPSGGVFQPSDFYPACFRVQNFVGTVASIKVRLHKFSHTWPGDVAMMLRGPGGETVFLMGFAGRGFVVANLELVFQDGSSALPATSVITSGTYAPTNYFTSAITFPSPAPAGPYGNVLSVFVGTNPNGLWHLFLGDNQPVNAGSLGSWDLVIDGNPLGCTCPSVPPTSLAIDNYGSIASQLVPCSSCDDVAAPVTDYDGNISLYAGNCRWVSALSPDDVYELNGKAFLQTSVELIQAPGNDCFYEMVLYCQSGTTTKCMWVGRTASYATTPVGTYTFTATSSGGGLTACLAGPTTIDVVSV